MTETILERGGTLVSFMGDGGYFAPRAAAFEERIDGVVAYDTCCDYGEVASPVLAAAKNPLAMKNIGVSWGYHNTQD